MVNFKRMLILVNAHVSFRSRVQDEGLTASCPEERLVEGFYFAPSALKSSIGSNLGRWPRLLHLAPSALNLLTRQPATITSRAVI